MAAGPPLPKKRCLRRPARRLAGLLGVLAGLSALPFLAGGGYEELLSRALLPLLLPAGSPEPSAAAAFPPPLPASFSLSPPACGPSSAAVPGLLVLVPSAPEHGARRSAVRRSWGSAREAGGLTVRTVFALGLPREASVQEALEREAAEHGDLLQGRFADTYGNLTLKTLAMLGWAASRCPGARFVLKADDDVFVNLPGLARHLRALQEEEPGGTPAVYLGRLHWRVAPDRDPGSRHYVPARLYPPPAFPPYCSGTAYVLSGRAASAVLAASRHLPLVPVEDVFVGLCARRAGLIPRHSARLAGSARYPPDACCYRELLFSVHGVSPGRMVAMWAEPERPCSAWQRFLGPARCKALAWLAGERAGS
ncbi:beta-1,3-galactosyltransferase 4-like [Pseudonaja textilis]|uniref:beta-1,3-galactosyltransferase 4-like n=1 Tax=Pseudonaja textilis TaxID=8673 RepID=UPI000EA85485|nr:beta-1,3-galactosyltransferase 4-like [Pseudonaja textilis]